MGILVIPEMKLTLPRCVLIQVTLLQFRLLPLHLQKKEVFLFFFSLTKLCQVLIFEITKSVVDSRDSNSDGFVTRRSTKSMKRKHDDDDDNDGEDISGTEAVLRRRNQLMKTMNMLPSHPTPKIAWTKSHELVILRGILDYEDERGVRYGSDWDAFHGYMKDLMNGFFTKKQLSHKVWKLKTRFKVNKARSNDGEGLSFTNTHDEQVFKFSKFVWAEKETDCADSSENMQEQQQKVLVSTKDINNRTECAASNENMPENQPKDINIKTERASSNENMQENQPKVIVSTKGINKKMECASSNKNMQEQQRKEALVSNKDVPCADQERGSYIRMVGKEKSCEGDGDGEDDELCVLQDMLEATLFQSLGKVQQTLLCQNLKNLAAQTRKELTDECKALLDEEMKLSIKKLTLSAKLANAGVSA